jgi:hypothetical protein
MSPISAAIFFSATFPILLSSLLFCSFLSLSPLFCGRILLLPQYNPPVSVLNSSSRPVSVKQVIVHIFVLWPRIAVSAFFPTKHVVRGM